MNQSTTAAHRLVWVEWVRGIAALVVALHHLVQPVWPAYQYFCANIFNLGRVGVVAFFVVSGFVIPLSYARQSTPVFIVRRFTRLYPVYWLILGVTLLMLWLHNEPIPSIPEILLNITMLQSLVATAIVGVAWTLTIELIYYFQQVGFKTFKMLDRSWMLGYLWVAIFLAALAAEHVLDRALPISFPMLLAISCLGHLWSLRLNGQVEKRPTVIFSTVVLVSTLFVPLFRADVDEIWFGWLYAVSSAGGVALFVLAYLLRNKFELKWAVWLGSISYALYLVHSLFLYWVEAVPPAWGWPSFVLATASAILVSWLLYRFVEQPFISIGKRYKGR